MYTQIDAPGASSTSANGINGNGQIAGSFTDSLGTHGFLDVGGMFTTLDVPGANSTSANGLNTMGGQIVGTYTDGVTQFGFVTVPDPSTLDLAGIGGVFLVVLRSLQRRR